MPTATEEPARVDSRDVRAAGPDFEAWMVTRQRRLLTTAYLLTGDLPAAEDLLQTALAKVYLSWDKVSAAQSVDAYARTILVNEHTSEWRRRRRHREVVADTSRYAVAVDDPQYDGTSDALWQAVRSLPERQRAVIVLRYYEQLSERETAETLGVSTGTVKSQASRALATLGTRLRPQSDPESDPESDPDSDSESDPDSDSESDGLDDLDDRRAPG